MSVLWRFFLYNTYPGNVNIFIYTEVQVKFETFGTESHKNISLYFLQMHPKLYEKAT